VLRQLLLLLATVAVTLLPLLLVMQGQSVCVMQ
jgi:hypothetical protein